MRVAGAVINPQLAEQVRDSRWLDRTLDEIWDRYFGDTPRVNIVEIGYGGAWKTRLGSITLSDDHRTTYIRINSLLRLPEVPEYVTLVTVAHEMVHYAHGFGSPLPQRYKHPHRGGIVKRELIRRGMELEYRQYDHWVYNYWYDLYDEYLRQDTRPTSA